jgi:A/G-specific adenine glycosylase
MDHYRAKREPTLMRPPIMMTRSAKLATFNNERVEALISKNARARFRRALLTWYEANRRDLPWRRTCDPYAIWLSEIMLQQTRVAAVLDHYRIFLDRFPNVAALAAASEDAVLAAWSGLGYYRRARMLHQCALQIVEKHDGCFPQNSEALRRLPGIGRYTAAAIGSIAFHEAVAVVDGNVERVLQRVGNRKLTMSESCVRAQELLSPARPGDFNQAMMELGATLCLPREPRCLICPIRRWCAAQGELSPAKAVARQRKQQIWCSLERRDGHVKLVQRSKKASLMAGMWELPQWQKRPDWVASDLHWRTFRHSITITDYTVHVLRNPRPGDGFAGKVFAPKTFPDKARGRWIAIDRIPDLPITGLTRKVLQADGVI